MGLASVTAGGGRSSWLKGGMFEAGGAQVLGSVEEGRGGEIDRRGGACLTTVNMNWFLLFNWTFSLPLCPQSTASLSGRLLDPSPAAIPHASLTLSNPLTGFTETTHSSDSGAFHFTNVPFGNYTLSVEKPGFAPLSRRLALRSNVPAIVELVMELATASNTVSVVDFDREALVHPQDTGSRAEIHHREIDRLPLASRGLEAALLTFPGFAQNANGAIHPRGAHNQMTFVVDGMPVTDQLTGAFANAVDPSIVQTVELFTGNIPAEYGSKVAAVANVTTRSGLGAGRILGGAVTLGSDSQDTLSSQARVSGERGRLGYSASLSAMKTNRYLDAVNLANFHNGGNLERAFSRFDYQPSDRDSLRVNIMAGNSSFELANLASQQANGMDQRQGLRDFSFMLGWVRTLTARATWDVTASVRTAEATLTPSPGDIPVTAGQTRRLTTATLWNRVNTVRGRHNVKAGADAQYFPVSERFTFGITSATFNAPELPGFIDTLLDYDLTRGGRLFRFADAAAGGLYSGFIQDNISLGRWNLALGLRYDAYRFLTRGNQMQPRVGVSYYLRETGTVLRASYNRTYQTPPNENLLLASSEQSSVLVARSVRSTLGQGVVRIRPERQNFYEAGVQQAIGSHLSADASFYHKDARDQQDNNNFFNTGIIFPMSLAAIRVNGVEGRVALLPARGFSATASVTHARAVSTPPFTGGLFIGNPGVILLSSGPFVIDHDQKLGVQTVVAYDIGRGLSATVSTRYDSGLVTNPSDPAVVARDADYAPLLPYVNLTSNPPRTLPRAITNVGVGYKGERWEADFQVMNVTNKTALYNFQSLFVGTRLAAPRTAALRLRWLF